MSPHLRVVHGTSMVRADELRAFELVLYEMTQALRSQIHRAKELEQEVNAARLMAALEYWEETVAAIVQDPR